MTETGAGNAARVPVDGSTPVLQPGDLRLEVVPLPVTDLDRAKTFYAQRVGFVLDVDTSPRDGVRFVQLTPPGSACSIALTEGVAFTAMPPGGLRGLHLVVPDIAAARRAMIDRGVDVGPIEDVGDAQ